MSAPRGTGTAVALLSYSLLTNRREGRQGWYVVRNLATGVMLIASARRAGLTWDDLGLGSARIGWRVGLRAAAASAAAVLLGTAAGAGHRLGRRLLADRRATLDARDLVWQTLIRIPIGTAAFEEVAFRGVLLGIVAVRYGPRAGLLTSSVVFGLWHIGPTLAALRINDVTTGRTRTCAAAVTLTTFAGFALGRLRIAGGHVVTPWLAHWALNAMTLLAAAAWQRSGRSLDQRVAAV